MLAHCPLAANEYLMATLGKLKAPRKGTSHPTSLCWRLRISIPLTGTLPTYGVVHGTHHLRENWGGKFSQSPHLRHRLCNVWKYRTTQIIFYRMRTTRSIVPSCLSRFQCLILNEELNTSKTRNQTTIIACCSLLLMHQIQ